MKSSVLKRRLEHQGMLPCLPGILSKVKGLLSDSTSGMRQVGQLASVDPPLVARLLRTANSAVYGLKSTVISAGHAASIIGEDDLRDLLASAGDSTYRDLKGLGDFDPLELWRHARLAALLIPDLPNQFHRDQQEELLEACALLHNIGQFAMLHSLGSEYIKLCAQAMEKRVSVERLEQKVLGFDHTDVGETLGKRWGMHPKIVTVIRNHASDKRSALADPAVASVRVVDVVATAVLRDDTDNAFRRLPGPILTEWKLSAGDVEALCERASFLRHYHEL